MNTYKYDRAAAVAYARKWAYDRNPRFYDFSNIGGDCTNFVSQCLYAGCGVMNYASPFGWFYRSVNSRTPSWTGVEFLHNFLVGNDGLGPYAKIVELKDVEAGDIVQLGDGNGRFYHSPFVVDVSGIGFDGDIANGIMIAAHSYDALDKPLASYNAAQYRALHILGYRK